MNENVMLNILLLSVAEMNIDLSIWGYFSWLPAIYLLVLSITQMYNSYYRYILICALVLVVIVELFKIVSSHWLDRFPWMQRPEGATNCNCWNGGGDASGDSGFPSGHVALISFILTSMFIYLIRNTSHPILISIWGLYAFVQVVFVALARLKKKCHTQMQVIAGAFVGISSAMMFSVWRLNQD